MHNFSLHFRINTFINANRCNLFQRSFWLDLLMMWTLNIAARSLYIGNTRTTLATTSLSTYTNANILNCDALLLNTAIHNYDKPMQVSLYFNSQAELKDLDSHTVLFLFYRRHQESVPGKANPRPITYLWFSRPPSTLHIEYWYISIFYHIVPISVSIYRILFYRKRQAPILTGGSQSSVLDLLTIYDIDTLHCTKFCHTVQFSVHRKRQGTTLVTTNPVPRVYWWFSSIL